MKKISLLAGVVLLSGCSINVIDPANVTTEQLYDLSDPEGDGVINARDNCIDTPLGAAVDNNGCGVDVIEKVRVTLLVNFDNNSSVVDAKYFPEIQKLAGLLEEYKSVNVSIEGHTSQVGTAKYNKLLSLKRAEAVKSILVNKYGINRDRVAAVGYGFEQLLNEGHSDYANAQNRRIVAEIAGGKEVIDMKWNIYSVDDRE
ncbi:OmpA family protein [Psychromonas sp. 14N.309.X.WAT.B.A12]|jgi:OmpA-OmpF porin, OOP family|uniref:OmpA family protein n=1 Tax=unclassified Psychromonas TaxID=2614957 RepID=UPI0025B24155|nr:OmpA family protein [Psychromonas sp. 14N.309.X.WAT.B.A12]MDN2663027.1 OmpA family protein [Psychromonas sp. 14N.309.X.WAT.B.A12]